MAVAFVKLVPSMYTALRDFFSSSSFFQGKKKEGRKVLKCNALCNSALLNISLCGSTTPTRRS